MSHYLLQTQVGRFLDVVITKAKNAPAAFAQICGLSLILRRSLGLAMPILAIAKDDQIPAMHKEVNGPSTVHRNLFFKRNTVVREQLSHCFLDIRTPVDARHIYLGTGSRAKVLGGTSSVNTTWIGFKWFAACCACATYFWFPRLITFAAIVARAMFRSAFTRAAELVSLALMAVLGREYNVTPRTLPSCRSWHVGGGAFADVEALHTTELLVAASGTFYTLNNFRTHWTVQPQSLAAFACAVPRAILGWVASQVRSIAGGCEALATSSADVHALIITERQAAA